MNVKGFGQNGTITVPAQTERDLVVSPLERRVETLERQRDTLQQQVDDLRQQIEELRRETRFR